MAPITRTLARILGCFLLVMALTGCGSTAVPELTPDQAADALKKNLSLSTDQIDCMRAKFASDPNLAMAMNVNEKPTATQRDVLAGPMRQCVPIDEFALIFALTQRDPASPTDDLVVPCVQNQIALLSPAKQDLLYVFAANPAAFDDVSAATSIGPIALDVSKACNLGPSIEAGTTSTTAGVLTTEPTSTP